MAVIEPFQFKQDFSRKNDRARFVSLTAAGPAFLTPFAPISGGFSAGFSGV
jgi:hypothetical protein